MKSQIKQYLTLSVLLFNFLQNVILSIVFYHTGLYSFLNTHPMGYFISFYLFVYGIFILSLLPYRLHKVKSNGFVRGAIFLFTGLYHILYPIYFYTILPYFVGLELIFILMYFTFKNYIDEIKQKKEI